MRQWRNVRRWLPGVLISVVALVLVFRLATFEGLTEAFKAARPLNMIISFLILVVSGFSRAMAWRVLLGAKPPIWRTYLIIQEGYLLNYLFPLKAGELGRAVFMGRELKISPFQVLSSIVIERAFDVAVAAALVLTTLPLALGLDWAGPAAAISMGVVLLGLLGLYLLARFRDRVHGWLEKLPARFDKIKRLVLPRLDSLLEGLSALTSPRRFLTALGWIAFAWVQWIGMHYIMLLHVCTRRALLVDDVHRWDRRAGHGGTFGAGRAGNFGSRRGGSAGRAGRFGIDRTGLCVADAHLADYQRRYLWPDWVGPGRAHVERDPPGW